MEGEEGVAGKKEQQEKKEQEKKAKKGEKDIVCVLKGDGGCIERRWLVYCKEMVGVL